MSSEPVREVLLGGNRLERGFAKTCGEAVCFFSLFLSTCLGSNHIMMKSINVMTCLGILFSPVQKKKVPVRDSLAGEI